MHKWLQLFTAQNYGIAESYLFSAFKVHLRKIPKFHLIPRGHKT